MEAAPQPQQHKPSSRRSAFDYYELMESKSGTITKIPHRYLRYLGSGGNCHALYMNIPSENVLSGLNEEISKWTIELDPLLAERTKISADALTIAVSKGRTKPEFNTHQSQRLGQIEPRIAQLKQLIQKNTDIKKRIYDSLHPIYGTKVLRIKIRHETEHDLFPDFKELIPFESEGEESRFAGTNLVSEVEMNKDKPEDLSVLFTERADHTKYGRIFSLNHLSECFLKCPLTGAVHKADITDYSSYGDLDFLFEKQLDDVNHERNKDVLGWVIARMLYTLKILHCSFKTVHGDVKTANFLVNKCLTLRLVDYDFTKLAGTKAKIGGTHGYQYPYHPIVKDSSGKIVEKPSFKYIPEFDVYAVGATIFKLAVGNTQGTLLDSKGDFSKFGKYICHPSEIPVTYFHNALKEQKPFFETKLGSSPWFRQNQEFQSQLSDLLVFLTMPKFNHLPPDPPKPENPAKLPVLKVYQDDLNTLAVLLSLPEIGVDHMHVDRQSCQSSIKLAKTKINEVKARVKNLVNLHINSKRPPTVEVFTMLYADRIGDYLGSQIYEYLVQQLQVHLDDMAESFRLAQELFASKFQNLAPPNSKLELVTASKMFESTNFSSSGSKEGNNLKSVFSSVFGELLELAQLLLNRIGGLSRMDRGACDGKSHWFPCFSENFFSLDVHCRIRNSTNGQVEKQLKVPRQEIGFGNFLLSSRGDSPLELSKLIGFPQLVNLKHPQQIPLVVNTKSAPEKLEWDWLYPSQILSRLERIHRSSTTALQDAKIHAQSNSESLENTKSCLPLLEKLLPKTAATKLKSRISGLITADDIPDLEICFLQTFKSLSQVFTHLRPQGDSLEMDVSLDKKAMVEYLEAQFQLTVETKTTCSVQNVVDKLEQNLKQTKTLKVCKRIDAVKPGIHEGFFKHVKVDMKFNWGTSNPHVAKLQKLVRNLERGLQGITSKKNHTPK